MKKNSKMTEQYLFRLKKFKIRKVIRNLRRTFKSTSKKTILTYYEKLSCLD